MLFSIVVPVSRVQEHHCQLIESLNKQIFPHEEFELIVVGSIHELPVPVKFSHKVCFLDQGGANQARIIGETEARGRYIFFIDDDCIIDDPYLLQKWKEFLNQRDDIDLAGGCYRVEGVTPLDRAYNAVVDMWQKGGDKNQPHLVGGHLIVRKEVFSSVHFDGTIRYGGSETDFCMRALRQGKHLVLNSDLTIRHRPNLTIQQFVRKAYLQGMAKNRHRSSVPLVRQASLILRKWYLFWLLPAFAVFWLASQAGKIKGKFFGSRK